MVHKLKKKERKKDKIHFILQQNISYILNSMLLQEHYFFHGSIEKSTTQVTNST